MRAVFLDDGKLVLREIDEPSQEGKRVQVRSIGICGSDLHMMDMRFPLECVIGHEVAGVLDDGTPVAVETMVPCNECAHCGTGDYHLCQQAASSILGVSRNGAMADVLYAPESSFVYLPSNVDAKDACLIEPLAVAAHGIRKSGLAPNQRVAIIGGGTIGLCAVAAAKAVTTEVGLSARYDHQIAAGRILGSDGIEGNYDLVIECAGTQSGVDQAIELCRPAGKLLTLGTYWAGFSFPHMTATMKEITFITSHMYSANGTVRDFDVAAILLSRNSEIAKTLITHRFPLDQVEQAFAAARDRKSGAIKVVLEP